MKVSNGLVRASPSFIDPAMGVWEVRFIRAKLNGSLGVGKTLRGSLCIEVYLCACVEGSSIPRVYCNRLENRSPNPIVSADGS